MGLIEIDGNIEMLTLVVGCGSIGKRHIRNLGALKAGEIIAHDVKLERCHEVEQECGIKAYSEFEEALAQKPDVALICTASPWTTPSPVPVLGVLKRVPVG